jgi:uncharacterized repeat protein (TIGR01451 family)
MRIPAFIALTSALLISLPGAAADKGAPAKNNISVQSIAEQEVEVKLPNGKMERKRQPVVKAVPGTEIIFTTRFINQGKQSAGNIVLTNPVPANTAYVGGSASGDNTDITYSLDGKAFNTPDKLKAKTPDGKERPALPAEYSHIRWTYKGELAASKSGEVSFRVTIK